jgi:RNA polymerase sigma-70 factor (ECF subfamily)
MENSPPTEGAAQPPARSLEELFRALESPLLAFALRLSRNHDSAEDCVQEAFLRLHPRLPTGEIADPRAWLYRTVHNLAISGFRTANRHVSLETSASSHQSGISNSPSESQISNPSSEISNSKSAANLSLGNTLADPAPLPDAELERLEAAGLARLLLDRLEPRAREIVMMKFYEDLSYKQIAARTGLTVGHVGYLLHHALKHLALELNRAGLAK